ncbi:Uncharacterized conserved protein YloU, alkaline shock protein (Asp23) family [Ruminococcaceae bacterium YRB3002]|nr:Uncharacterized conserved protein YloU, alkaline shock protein (Asp23) family [Ruminococcaceae bacterium YRB3002]
MNNNSGSESIKGDRSMTQGFVAQYAAEAALQIEGVHSLVPSFAVALKEKAGVVHEGKGVRVVFDENDSGSVSVTVYPVIEFGKIIPEVAWNIQEKIKEDVERFTGLKVDAVDVYVCGVVEVNEKEDRDPGTEPGEQDDISEFYVSPPSVKKNDGSRPDPDQDQGKGEWFQFK